MTVIKISAIPTQPTRPPLMIRKGRDSMSVRADGFQNKETLLPEQRMYLDRCMDFLARMIEKYGDEVKLPPPETGTTKQPGNAQADAA